MVVLIAGQMRYMLRAKGHRVGDEVWVVKLGVALGTREGRTTAKSPATKPNIDNLSTDANICCSPFRPFGAASTAYSPVIAASTNTLFSRIPSTRSLQLHSLSHT